MKEKVIGHNFVVSQQTADKGMAKVHTSLWL